MRYALIKDGSIVNVIQVADGFLARADPRWLAQFDRIEPDSDARAEPGGSFDSKRRAFTRAERIEQKTDLDLIKERIAALESRG
jgi:hypothetical protein